MSSLEGILEVILSCVSPENPKFHTRVVPDYKGNTLSPQTGKLLVRPTNQYPVKFESLSAALQNLHPRTVFIPFTVFCDALTNPLQPLGRKARTN